jgi:hypothetical protein
VHPEGHVAQRNSKRRVAPLAHVVRPEGHVAIKGVDGVSLASPSLQCLCKTLSITIYWLAKKSKTLSLETEGGGIFQYDLKF